MAGQKHAGYVRGLDDLRTARALLQRPNEAQAPSGLQDEVSLALTSIDEAIAQINTVSPDNGKKSHDVSGIDAHTKWSKRLSMSFRMLEQAKLDCAKEKDNSGDAGLQARVQGLIDQAHDRIRVAIDTVNFDYSARSLPTRND
jgi:hypothetical protein